MRLQQHISESRSKEIPFDGINELIHKNCKKYLSLIKGREPLYRGMDNEPSLGLKSVRKDRRPYGMTKLEAAHLNNWLEKDGHARRDRSIMATSNKDNVRMFGESYYVFPLDPIVKYTWVETADINLDDDQGWHSMMVPAWIVLDGGIPKNTLMSDDYAQKVTKNLKKPFEDHFHTNEGWKTAVKKEYEMWIECNEYYFARTDLFHWGYKKQELFL